MSENTEAPAEEAASSSEAAPEEAPPQPAEEEPAAPAPEPAAEAEPAEVHPTSPAEKHESKQEIPSVEQEHVEHEKRTVEKSHSKEEVVTERKRSSVEKVEKGAHQKEKHSPHEKEKGEEIKKKEASEQEITQQKSSKMSDTSLRRQSRESSKEFARRKSTRSIKNAVGSVVSFRRGSIAEYFDRQKTAKFMNTYKLDSDNPFNVEKVTKILEEVLIEALDNLTYDVEKVPKQAKWASSAIRAKVKEQEFDRYKIICIVTIGERRSQDMFSTYRFLWDIDRDKHASFVHENMSVYAIAICFGVYYE